MGKGHLWGELHTEVLNPYTYADKRALASQFKTQSSRFGMIWRIASPGAPSSKQTPQKSKVSWKTKELGHWLSARDEFNTPLGQLELDTQTFPAGASAVCPPFPFDLGSFPLEIQKSSRYIRMSTFKQGTIDRDLFYPLSLTFPKKYAKKHV